MELTPKQKQMIQAANDYWSAASIQSPQDLKKWKDRCRERNDGQELLKATSGYRFLKSMVSIPVYCARHRYSDSSQQPMYIDQIEEYQHEAAKILKAVLNPENDEKFKLDAQNVADKIAAEYTMKYFDIVRNKKTALLEQLPQHLEIYRGIVKDIVSPFIPQSFAKMMQIEMPGFIDEIMKDHFFDTPATTVSTGSSVTKDVSKLIDGIAQRAGNGRASG